MIPDYCVVAVGHHCGRGIVHTIDTNARHHLRAVTEYEDGIVDHYIFRFDFLILIGKTGVAFNRRSVKCLECYGIGGVCPKEQEGEPAEELNQTYCPECCRSLAEQCDYIRTLLLVRRLVYAIVLVVEFRRPFPDFNKRINHAKQQNSRSDIE